MVKTGKHPVPKLGRMNLHSVCDKLRIDRPTMFITGAATSIGRAVAERLLREGWFVGIYDVDQEGIRSVQKHAQAGRCIAERLDVTSSDDWQRAMSGFQLPQAGAWMCFSTTQASP